MKRILTTIATLSALALGSQSLAASFAFNFTYDGSDITLDAGSDTPDGTELVVGDEFTIHLTAAGGFFRALADFNQSFPMSFAVSDAATRDATINTEFYLDGGLVDSTSETASQSLVHVGAQNFDFSSGFEFDEIILHWTFDAIDNPLVQTIISTAFSSDFFNSFGNSNRPFFNDPNIAFVTGDPVPLPAAALLFVTGFAGLRAVRKRKAA